MNLINFLFILYLIIGVIVCYFDWIKYHKQTYESLNKDEIEDNMLNIYWIIVIALWPIFLIKLLVKS